MSADPVPNGDEFTVRSYRPEDAIPLWNLFRETVRRVNSRDYDPRQIEAWAPAELPIESWSRRFGERVVLVAVQGDRPVGFGELDACGHLDRFYVSADHQRRGIGRAILNGLLVEARNLGLRRVEVEASITARPFFEAMGFIGAVPQTVNVRGVDFLNYRLERLI